MTNMEPNKGEIVMYQPDETIRLEVRSAEPTPDYSLTIPYSVTHFANWYRWQMAVYLGRHNFIELKTIGKLSILTSRLKNSLLGQLWAPEASRLN